MIKLSNDIRTTSNSIVILHGPPKHGKTFMAMTASEKFPAEGYPAKDMTVLDDLLILQCDKEGTVGLGAYNISVPTIDMGDLGDTAMLEFMFTKALPAAQASVREGRTKKVVIDITPFDAAIIGSLEEQGVNRDAQFWGQVAAKHAQLFRSLKALGVPIICIAHSKAGIDLSKSRNLDVAKQAAIKKASQSSPTDHDAAAPAITGKAWSQWMHTASMILPVFAEKAGLKWNRYVYPTGHLGHYGFTRHRFLNEQKKVLADFREIDRLVNKADDSQDKESN